MLMLEIYFKNSLWDVSDLDYSDNFFIFVGVIRDFYFIYKICLLDVYG